MIPKIIHYTWFSGDPYPPEIRQCIDSWEKLLPDWEFRKWDMETINDIDSAFLKEAISVRKWAYAADYVRLYALVNHGGVYLDTDAMLLKDVTPFLAHRAFIGKESSIHFMGDSSAQYLTSHFMGAEKGHPFLADCLEYFTGRHFVVSDSERLPDSLRYNQVLLPFIQSEIAKQYGCDLRPLTQSIQSCKEGLVVYPSEYFDATGTATKNSTVRHLALGSWREGDWRKQYNYTFAYKCKWRIIALFKRIMKKFDYECYKLE